MSKRECQNIRAGAMMYDTLLATVAYDIETESFVHKGITLQRLTRDGLWYAIYNNSIIKIDQYRNDIVAWIDCHCGLTPI